MLVQVGLEIQLEIPLVLYHQDGMYSNINLITFLGVESVDMSVFSPLGVLLYTWTLSNPADLIPSVVGGNRYGWFAYNEFPYIGIDDVYRINL